MSQVNFLESVGIRIRKRRTELGMSQETLANLIGKTQDSISNYETGARATRITELQLLAKALQVSINYFIIEEDVEMMGHYAKASSRLREKLEDLFYAAIKIETSVIEMLSANGVYDDELTFNIVEQILHKKDVKRMSEAELALLEMWQKFKDE